MLNQRDVTRRPLIASLLAFGGAAAALLALRNALAAYQAHHPFVVDDAYITLRYAEHLAGGQGAVWNPGERVEGYTSFLAVAAIAVLRRVGVEPIAGARLVNLAGFALLVGAVAGYGLRIARGSSRVAVAMPALLVAASPPLYVWIHGRLEAPLFAGLVAVALLLTSILLEAPGRRRLAPAAGLAVGLLPLVRPDGAFFAGICGLFVVAATYRHGRAGVRDAARFAGTAIAVAAAHLSFRWFYYGEWVPNTVYAKATGLSRTQLVGTGLSYAADFVTATPQLPLVLIAIALLPFALANRARRLPAALLAASALGYTAVIVLAGGDHMPAHRLLLPVVAPLALLCAEGLQAVTSRGAVETAPTRAAAAVLAGALLIGVVPIARYPRAEVPDPAAYVGTLAGRFLRTAYPPGTLVALHTAGATPYFAPGLRFIDMLGLNDAHIARRRVDRLELPAQYWPGHAKGDGDYVLSRRPDVIILGPAEGTTADRPWFLSDLELARSPRFVADYILREHVIDASSLPDHTAVPATRTGHLRLRLYERRDLRAASRTP